MLFEFELIAILFNPALRLLVTVQTFATNKNNQEKLKIFSVPTIQSKFQVFEILGILFEIPRYSNSRCEKPSISKFLIPNTQHFDQNPRFSIEILGIRIGVSIEILGFSFEILRISKRCYNRIPYISCTLKVVGVVIVKLAFRE